MADDEKLPTSIQESIATAITLVDDENSLVISSIVETDLFDPPFDDIVSRSLTYRKTFGRPPGKHHVDDVFAHVLEDRDHKQHNIYNRIISAMMRLSEGIDTKYILSRTSDFVKLKKVRAGIAQAAERYQKGGPNVITDLESIFRQTLKIGDQKRDYGFTLDQGRALAFLDRDESDYCKISNKSLGPGMEELDSRGVHPARKEMLLFIAPRNRGKSMWLHHCGKFALLKGWTVAHYTLENSDDMTAMRYFQSLQSGVRHKGQYYHTEFDKADKDNIRLTHQELKPKFIISDRDHTFRFLADYQKKDKRLANLRIRRFPTGRMSFEDLERDLDELAIVEKFVPDLLLIDYPQIMRMPNREKGYEALAQLFINLRGLAVERNLAIVVPQQGNRASESAGNVRGEHGGGSIETLSIADNALTYSQTAAEEQHGLARLYSQKVRNDQARMTVCITQHYPSGQFVMDSWIMNKQLKDEIQAYAGYKGDIENDSED